MLLEIVLTVLAWRKGWGARALLPFVYAFLGLFALGFLTGAAGIPFQTVKPFTILGDIGVVIALACMVRRGPRAAQTQAPLQYGGGSRPASDSTDLPKAA
jgi:hypothetical protein